MRPLRTSTFLTIKFLSSSRSRWRLNALGIIALLGVLISVAAFILVEGLISGNREDMKQKILGFSAHALLNLDQSSADVEALIKKIQAHPKVKSLDHFLEGEVFLRTQYGDEKAIRLRGIEPDYLKRHVNISTNYEPRETAHSLEKQNQKMPGILPGFQLVKDLRLAPFLMEEIELVFPLGEVGPTGEFQPNQRRFRVVGTMKTGFFEYDSQYAFIGLEESRYLLGDQYAEKLAVYFEDPENISQYQEFLQSLPGVTLVRTWDQQNERLFSALILERYGIIIILGLTLLLSTFNILSILWLIAHQRKREIALLRTLGLSRQNVAKLFYKMGLSLGFFGASLGVLLGWGLGLLFRKLGHFISYLDLPYYLESLPVNLDFRVMLALWLGAILCSVLATVFPAIEVKKIQTTNALRRLSE